MVQLVLAATAFFIKKLNKYFRDTSMINKFGALVLLLTSLTASVQCCYFKEDYEQKLWEPTKNTSETVLFKYVDDYSKTVVLAVIMPKSNDQIIECKKPEVVKEDNSNLKLDGCY